MGEEKSNSNKFTSRSERGPALDRINDYYKMVSSRGVNENYTFIDSTTKSQLRPEDVVFDTYFGKKPLLGEDILNKLKPPQESPDIPGYGILYNTIYQPGPPKRDSDSDSADSAGATAAKSLHDSYWYPSINSAGGDRTKSIPGNLYYELTGVTSNAENSPAGPPVAFTINVFRGPVLTEAKKNADQVELFLNHMPSFFPSMMSPYLNVEFQYPVYLDAVEFRQGQPRAMANVTKYTAPRPSLYRFLMGSEVEGPVSQADMNLSYHIPTRPTAELDKLEDRSYFTGMEMFTAPQTLTNMDTLKGDNKSRLNDVKPFVPAASIINASIDIMNAGAGQFLHKKANVVLKIHDKARLVEFSEFLRSPEGYRDLTVWLTFGWLAPKDKHTNIETAAYSKFINENMLVREAFMIKNNSFSLDASGQVQVTLELVSKGYKSIETESINFLSSGENLLQQTQQIIEEIRDNQDALGQRPEGVEIRIFQILDSAVAGNRDIDISGGEFTNIIQSTRAALTERKDISDKDRTRALGLLDKLAKLYAKKPAAPGEKEVTNLSVETINQAQHGTIQSARFNTCTNESSYDPFLPDIEKKVNNQKIFSDELITHMNDEVGLDSSTYKKSYKKSSSSAAGSAYKGESATSPMKYLAGSDKSRILVSFGKIFSVFCLPTLLNSAKKEGIDEVQINFYQFNDSCGPLSLHNIAEFPVNINDFKLQISDAIYRRGGESMSVQEFLSFFCQTQFMDNRAPGYGMRSYYEAYTLDKPQERKAKSEDEFNSKMSSWVARWGGFKKPNIAIKMETVINGDGETASDLLFNLQDRVGLNFDKMFVKAAAGTNDSGAKKIKKISIYDKQFTPYMKAEQVVLAGNKYKIYQGDSATKVAEKIKGTVANDPEWQQSNSVSSIEELFFKSASPALKTKEIEGGKNVLRDFVRDTVPTLTIGVNGSLIKDVNLSSKTDGYLGMVNMQGSSFRSKSTLTPNGLSMKEYTLPVRVVPASLTMTTLGCPVADVYQNYFIDLGTGTTIDNLYTCTKLSHNISQGKFETKWTFTFTDGYSKFFGAQNIDKLLADFNNSSPQK